MPVNLAGAVLYVLPWCKVQYMQLEDAASLGCYCTNIYAA